MEKKKITQLDTGLETREDMKREHKERTCQVVGRRRGGGVAGWENILSFPVIRLGVMRVHLKETSDYISQESFGRRSNGSNDRRQWMAMRRHC